MLKKNILKIAAIAMAATMAMPGAAFAAEPTANGKGIDTTNLQEYDTGKEGGAGWQDSKTKSATSDTENGHKENIYDGQIHLFYDTRGGQWQDPGADPASPTDNTSHNNGTYVVTIPTKIAYENMNIGKVDTVDTYDVNVRGAIGQNQKVTLAAETGQSLVNVDKSEITEQTYFGKLAANALPEKAAETGKLPDAIGAKTDKTTAAEVEADTANVTKYGTDAFRTFTAAQVYGVLLDDGSLSGTTVHDTITMSGEVTTAGAYEGAVAYTASLEDVTPQSGSGFSDGTFIG